MVTDQIVTTPSGAAVLVSTSMEDLVACPHCNVGIVLAEINTEPGCLAVACPHCEQRSLLVRLVSVFHRAVRWPSELLARLQGDEREPDSGAAIRMPAEVFTLSVSRGAVALLAMLWHRAEQTGSVTIESSIVQLARRQKSNRGMIRRWLIELEQVGALRERLDGGKRQRPRKWELLPLSGKEDHND